MKRAGWVVKHQPYSDVGSRPPAHLVAYGVNARDQLHVNLRVQPRCGATHGRGAARLVHALEDLLHHRERGLVARHGHGDDGRHLAQQRVHVVLGGQRAWLGLGLGLGLG